MHEPIRSQLEDILQGRLKAGQKAAVSAHLKECAGCAAELGQMGLQADLLRSLKAPEVPEMSACFYARVLQRVEAQGRPSFWTLFVDPVFGRRLVYATGSMFLLMASFLLATSGNDSELARTPVEMIAHPATTNPAAVRTGFGDDVQQDRDHFLATMASFSE
jgi:anti-sigma factor RsiW